MLDAMDTLFIGMFCGAVVGYVGGFFAARAIYRAPHWPHLAAASAPSDE